MSARVTRSYDLQPVLKGYSGLSAWLILGTWQAFRITTIFCTAVAFYVGFFEVLAAKSAVIRLCSALNAEIRQSLTQRASELISQRDTEKLNILTSSFQLHQKIFLTDLSHFIKFNTAIHLVTYAASHVPVCNGKCRSVTKVLEKIMCIVRFSGNILIANVIHLIYGFSSYYVLLPDAIYLSTIVELQITYHQYAA
jgi:hypothetical protein